jgi:hypothetical protein
MSLLIYLYRSIVSATFLIGSLRTNVPFVCVFFGLVFFFGFVAAANFQLGYSNTTTEAEYSLTLLKVSGGFGLLAIVAGWLVSRRLQYPNPRIHTWSFPNI